ncbi:unnamed protein product [Kuraishia capsulata CBS 1993]|uniref:Major facilitator superfamily (MFS) profile domain-containing protein n=1 Tax=Kuraishia capsulata CBS 1993 TaxID=1382522 RepID=W6MRY3_9ASCO|nr:uncharacterized protein KUCA_T00005500001 [Kuraishia capsulata CBS 1993]CDK29511.1 unnamed protein product [Kuraishia capsulata CBS 1993]
MRRLHHILNHTSAHLVQGNYTDNDETSKKADVEAVVDHVAEESSDTISLEALNEKEVQMHPNGVTGESPVGVQKAEAVALVWSKTAVYLTYAWIWICFFMLALEQSIGSNVMAFAYADFSAASQVSTVGILASIVGGVLTLPIAKTLNVVGRAEAYLIFVVVYIIGIIILAACNGPKSYAAGYTFYSVGYSAVYMILQVFIADTSGLHNRAFAFAFANVPLICTAFTGPLAAESFLKVTTWRWAYGVFAIVMPFVLVPLALVFKFYEMKAKTIGLLVINNSGRSSLRSVMYYIQEFDIVGAFILMAAFILFLLPFSLETYGRTEYKSASFIVMVVIGFLLFFVFAAWEKFFARTHFVKWELFRQRTVLGAFCLAAILFFSYVTWDAYFYNFVYVVYNLPVSKAGYMTQIYNVGSCFWSVVFGAWLRYIKTFKYTCLFFGLPLMFLGAGLMIHFRGQTSDIGYIIMCQIFIAFSGGTLFIGEDMAVMAAADREGIPMMLSVLNLSSSVGSAIGYAVAAAIYDNVFPSALRDALPADSKDLWTIIYFGGVSTQTAYPVGSDIRNAINYAYGQSQKNGAIAATCILVLAIPAITMWKNYKVDKKQNKGTVI